MFKISRLESTFILLGGNTEWIIVVCQHLDGQICLTMLVMCVFTRNWCKISYWPRCHVQSILASQQLLRNCTCLSHRHCMVTVCPEMSRYCQKVWELLGSTLLSVQDWRFYRIVCAGENILKNCVTSMCAGVMGKNWKLSGIFQCQENGRFVTI